MFSLHYFRRQNPSKILIEVFKMLNQIYFVTNETKLKQMVYSDSIYAWLLLYSHY